MQTRAVINMNGSLYLPKLSVHMFGIYNYLIIYTVPFNNLNKMETQIGFLGEIALKIHVSQMM